MAPTMAATHNASAASAASSSRSLAKLGSSKSSSSADANANTSAAAAALEALALDLRLVPGVALGPFTLGIPLWHTLDYLRSNPAHFPKVNLVLPSAQAEPMATSLPTPPSQSASTTRKKGSSSGSTASGTSTEPNEGDASAEAQAILISVHPHLHLVYSAHSQRLQLISFSLNAPTSGHDPSYRPVRIAYSRSLVYDSTVLLSGTSGLKVTAAQMPSVTLTRTSIHQTFGPTYPPRRVPAQDEFVVSYPGLTFTFPAVLPRGKAGDSSNSVGQELDKHAPASAFHIFAGTDLLRPAHVILPPATSHMLPSYAAASGATSHSRLGTSAAHNASGQLQAAVPPACLKAVIRPGHSVILHLYSHPPSQPLFLSASTTLQAPSALMSSMAREASPPAASSSPAGGPADSATTIKRDSPALSPHPPQRAVPSAAIPTHSYAHGARTLALILGQTTTQDVLAELGAPQRRFEKVDERLDIHEGVGVGAGRGQGGVSAAVVELARRRMWRAAHADGEGRAEDADELEFEAGHVDAGYYDNPTFWNYFDLGIDLLFSTPALTPASIASGSNASGANSVTRLSSSTSSTGAAGGVLLKVIVHSNVPGSALFQRYNRCPWVVIPPAAGAGQEVSFHEPIDALSSLLGAADDRIELDRATDADFLPASARTSASGRSGGRGASNASTSLGDARSKAEAASSSLKLDVRTWLHGFENRADAAKADQEVPEGGLIAEADGAGRICSVLIY